MAEDGGKPVLIGFEGVTVDEPQPSEPPPPAKAEGSEEIQLLTPDERAVQVRTFKKIDRRASNRDVRKMFPGRFFLARCEEQRVRKWPRTNGTGALCKCKNASSISWRGKWFCCCVA